MAATKTTARSAGVLGAVLALAVGGVVPAAASGSTDISMVADIDPEPRPFEVFEIGTAGGEVWLSLDDSSRGAELWKVDQASLLAELVADIAPGGAGSRPSGFADLGGVVLFSADGGEGAELWRSDGTDAGTSLVKDINPGSGSSNPTELTPVGSVLYFVADDGTHGAELWKTDGTTAGTELVRDIHVGADDGDLRWFVPVGDDLFFSADDGVAGIELWVSDGTAGGTAMPRELNAGPSDSFVIPLADLGGVLLFQGNDGEIGNELWRSDGTAAGTTLVEDISPGEDAGTFGNGDVAVNAGFAYFAAFDPTHRWSVWKSDGTEDGTSFVFGVDNIPRDFEAVGATVYFSRSGLGTLWKTDGTTAGTSQVADTPEWPSDLTDVDGTLFFRGEGPSVGIELYVSDGTAAGTRLVRDIDPGPGSSMPGAAGTEDFDFTPVGGDLYVRATDGDGTDTAWMSDGTTATEITIPSTFTQGSEPEQLEAAGGTLFFSAEVGSTGRELYASDGTSAGTALVDDISPTGSSDPGDLTALGSSIVFRADDGATGSELWASDGTAAGANLLRDINPGPDSSIPQYLAEFGGEVYFNAKDPTNGAELWKTDGTAAGTQLVSDIRPGSGSSAPRNFTPVGSWLYFVADDGVHGTELWKTDGTAAGTVMVADIEPGPTGSVLYSDNWLTAHGGRLLFLAETAATGRELWVSDGTAAGTVLVKDVHPGPAGSFAQSLHSSGDLVFFSADDGTTGSELWQTDGTTAGTVLTRDLRAGSGGSYPGRFADVGSTTYFEADDGVTGSELWTTDGTSAGTVQVRDVQPGAAGSNPRSLTAFGGSLYFAANGGAGAELWRSDGTEAGTEQVGDINPGASPASPGWLTVMGSSLYFSADDGTHGAELWRALVVNSAPTADAGGPDVGAEGAGLALDGSGSFDPDGDPLSYQWSVDSAPCVFDDATSPTPILTCDDDVSFAVKLTVSDGLADASDWASVQVDNVAPVVGAIVAPTEPVRVGTVVAVTADFTDAGVLDTHTATWDWGDGTTPGTVTETGGSGTVTGIHTYAVPGVYEITSSVIDDDGGEGISIYQYVVVFDPDGGFVTGGGVIDSPAGAYRPDPTLTGTAGFGFVSRYTKGKSTPTGSTEFQFQAADLRFMSSSYDSLVVTGGDFARIQGTGTINGTGEYEFAIWAGDDEPDTFRIKIWTEDEAGDETVVYDNGSDQALREGSIVIHTKK